MTEGMVDFSGISLPFTANDIVSGSMGLLGILAGIVVLAIAFPLLSKFIGAVKSAIGKK